MGLKLLWQTEGFSWKPVHNKGLLVLIGSLFVCYSAELTCKTITWWSSDVDQRAKIMALIDPFTVPLKYGTFHFEQLVGVLVMAWQFAVIVYIASSIFRVNGTMNYVYCYPELFSENFYFTYGSSFIISGTWWRLLIHGRDFEWSMFLSLTRVICAVVCLVSVLKRLHDKHALLRRELHEWDLCLIKWLVTNGLSVYAGWVHHILLCSITIVMDQRWKHLFPDDFMGLYGHVFFYYLTIPVVVFLEQVIFREYFRHVFVHHVLHTTRLIQLIVNICTRLEGLSVGLLVLATIILVIQLVFLGFKVYRECFKRKSEHLRNKLGNQPDTLITLDRRKYSLLKSQ